MSLLPTQAQATQTTCHNPRKLQHTPITHTRSAIPRQRQLLKDSRLIAGKGKGCSGCVPVRCVEATLDTRSSSILCHSSPQSQRRHCDVTIRPSVNDVGGWKHQHAVEYFWDKKIQNIPLGCEMILI